jgi:TRAP transporter TAXI family solute receptor
MNTKKTKCLCVFLCLLMLGSLLVGCSTQKPSGAGNEQPEKQPEEQSEQRPQSMELAWGSSSTGGGYFYATGVLAPILTERIDYLNVTNVATGASADNVKRILLGELDFGMAHGSNIYEGATGKGAFAGLDGENIRLVAYYMPGPHYFVTLEKKTNINTMADLVGKKVACGQPGSGAQYNSDLVLDTLGIECNREYLQFADAGRALVDGQIDAIGATGIPVGAISELSETQKIQIIKTTDAEMDKLLKEVSFYYEDQIPIGAYKGIMEPVTVPFVPMFIVCHKDVPDMVVYDILEVIFDPDVYKTLGEGFGQWKFTKPGIDLMENLGSPPIHPGALKFYEEFKDKYNFDEYGTSGWVNHN